MQGRLAVRPCRAGWRFGRSKTDRDRAASPSGVSRFPPPKPRGVFGEEKWGEAIFELGGWHTYLGGIFLEDGLKKGWRPQSLNKANEKK